MYHTQFWAVPETESETKGADTGDMTTDDGLPPEAELLWGRRPRPSRGPRPSISVEQIVRRAIQLADRDGLDALSMQKLAAALGVGTMSLYRYVPGKDELVGLMLDAALGEPREPDPGEHWRDGLARWAWEVRDAFLRHPWMLPLVTRPRLMGPHETAWLEAALRTVAGIGLDPPAMFEVVLLVNGFVRGAVQPYVDPARPGAAPDGTEARLVFDRRDRYPTLATVLGAGTFDTRGDGDDHGEHGFEFGLARILDGVERFVGEIS